MNLLIIYILILFSSALAEAESLEECKLKAHELLRTEGSAGTWDNLRNNKGSLRYETNELLSSGLTVLDPETSITITSEPKKYIREHKDANYCKTKLDETSKTPIVFSNKKFKTSEELNSWIADFSQGKGKEGRELYKKCDKSCSPQYSYLINKDETEDLMVNASVVCGLARDKDDNTYLLKLSCSPRAGN